MSISDDEIRKTLQVLLSDKSKLLVLSQLLDANLVEREKEIADSQKRLQSESRTIIGKLLPNAEPYLRLQENMTTIYANMNRDVRFLRMMVEAIALNNIDQPEPEHIDVKAMVTEEHKKIMDWFHKYIEHLIGEDKAKWLCKQIRFLGIGLPELMAIQNVVMKKADPENVSLRTAAYRLINDIDNYEKIGGLKNQISQLVIQKYTFEQISAPREKAITALMRLETLGITDYEILNVCEWLNRMREKSLITQYP